MVVVASGRALAAAPAPPARPSPDSRQYRALLEDAVSEYDARRYEEARALFRRAHAVSPNARTLRGIGMASFELREYVEALRSLEASLIDKRRPLTSIQRQQVQSLVDRARAFVGRFLVHLSPKDAVLRVDGTPATLEDDGSLLLGFGRHFLTAEARGKNTENREVNVIGGEREDLAFELRADLTAAPRTQRPVRGELAVASNVETQDQGGRASRGGWWFAGAGLLAGGAVGSFFWWRYQNDQVASCDLTVAAQGVCRNRGVLILQRRLAGGAMIGAAAGALALGTIGTVIWAKSGEKESGIAWACTPGPGAVRCELELNF
jgi:hypothetical protein